MCLKKIEKLKKEVTDKIRVLEGSLLEKKEIQNSINEIIKMFTEHNEKIEEKVSNLQEIIKSKQEQVNMAFQALFTIVYINDGEIEVSDDTVTNINMKGKQVMCYRDEDKKCLKFIIENV